MNVDAEAAAIVRAAMKRPRKQHWHCIYCTVIVDEAVPIKGGAERELFSETPDGPVCDYCKADPLAKERVQAAMTHSERKRAHNKQRHLADSRILSDEERAAREEAIAQLYSDGKRYGEIGEIVGLTISEVGNALKRIRRRRDIEIVRLADLGWSWKRISNKIGVSPSMVGKVVKRNCAQT